MDGATIFRRTFHLASPIFLGYYVLPEVVHGTITRTSLLILFAGTAWCIEVARISLGLRLFGMRGYEGQRVSAYAQGTLGLVVGLLFVDPRIVIPVFIGMAWIDPFASQVRERRWPRPTVGVVYFALFLGIEVLMNSFMPTLAAVYALAATLSALAVEGRRFAHLDDDLLMQVVPYVVLHYLVAGFGTGWFPALALP